MEVEYNIILCFVACTIKLISNIILKMCIRETVVDHSFAMRVVDLF